MTDSASGAEDGTACPAGFDYALPPERIAQHPQKNLGTGSGWRGVQSRHTQRLNQLGQHPRWQSLAQGGHTELGVALKSVFAPLIGGFEQGGFVGLLPAARAQHAQQQVKRCRQRGQV